MPDETLGGESRRRSVAPGNRPGRGARPRHGGQWGACCTTVLRPGMLFVAQDPAGARPSMIGSVPRGGSRRRWACTRRRGRVNASGDDELGSVVHQEYRGRRKHPSPDNTRPHRRTEAVECVVAGPLVCLEEWGGRSAREARPTCRQWPGPALIASAILRGGWLVLRRPWQWDSLRGMHSSVR